jgi:hypothetical protein
MTCAKILIKLEVEKISIVRFQTAYQKLKIEAI